MSSQQESRKNVSHPHASLPSFSLLICSWPGVPHLPAGAASPSQWRRERRVRDERGDLDDRQHGATPRACPPQEPATRSTAAWDPDGPGCRGHTPCASRPHRGQRANPHGSRRHLPRSSPLTRLPCPCQSGERANRSPSWLQRCASERVGPSTCTPLGSEPQSTSRKPGRHRHPPSTPKVCTGIRVTCVLSSGVLAISRMPYFLRNWRYWPKLRPD